MAIPEFNEYLAQYLENVVAYKSANTVLISDSNINLLSNATKGVEDYLNNLYSFGFFPIFRKATRIQSDDVYSLIDHVFVSNPNLIQYACQNVEHFSDHNLLFFSIAN